MTRQEILAIAKPILFNTEMVCALLEGRKTVTRRVVKKAAVDAVLSSKARISYPETPDEHFIARLCNAPYEVGNYLYVRETWAEQGYNLLFKANFTAEEIKSETHWFEKEQVNLCDLPKWHPSIHMPKEAARIFLRVTDVRVERLREIDHAIKIAAEGADIGEHCCQCIDNYSHPCCTDEGEGGRNECNMLDDIRCNFVYLWDSTIKKQDFARYGWAANPWVWVIEFERVIIP